MPTTRILITFFAVLLGLVGVLLMPKKIQLRPTAVGHDLPTFVGDWFGTPVDISQKERDALAKDTIFSRREYSNLEGRRVTASIVISGHDLNNSIHRPERCLPAQGWTVNSSAPHEVKVQGMSLGAVPVRQLFNYNMQEIPPQGSGALAQGGSQRVYNITNYFFVGADTITRSHYGRTFKDMADRVFLGQTQQWAYVTFSTNYGVHVVPKTGMSPEDRAKLEKLIDADREAADKALQQFMVEVMPELLPQWKNQAQGMISRR